MSTDTRQHDAVIRWGVLGSGRMAQDFALGLQHAAGAALVAVGSRDGNRAERFAAHHGGVTAHDSYEALVNDEAVDVVYVATPHHRHCDDALMALSAGKAVLVEKAFATNADEAQRIVDAARDAGLFCMEAMWTRFVPAVRRLRRMIDDGAIGEVRSFVGDFSLPTRFEPDGRFFNREMGGGALLDRGVYPLSLAVHLIGLPDGVGAVVRPASTGVDEHASMQLRYDDGRAATLTASLVGYGPNSADVIGTTGRIHLHEPIARPERLTVQTAPAPITCEAGDRADSAASTWKAKLRQSALVRRVARPVLGLLRGSHDLHLPCRGNGYNYEAEEVVRCLREGLTESPVMPLDESVAIMRIIDEALAELRPADEPTATGA